MIRVIRSLKIKGGGATLNFFEIKENLKSVSSVFQKNNTQHFLKSKF